MYYRPEFYIEEGQVERQEDYHCICAGDGCYAPVENKMGWTQRLRIANAALKESRAILNEVLGPQVEMDEDALKSPGCSADALGCEVWEAQHLAEYVEKRLRDLMERF